MKKSLIFSILGALSTLLTVTTSYTAESGRALKADVAQLKKQNGEAVPTDLKKLNTLQKAIKKLDETLTCLILDKKCTPRDRLALNYALGFIIGYKIDIGIMTNLLRNYDTKKPLNAAGVYGTQATQEILFTLAHLRGILITPVMSAIKQLLLTAVFLAGEIKEIGDQTMQSESIIAFMKEISKWVAMNIKCIWSESSCQVPINKIVGTEEYLTPAMKRESLYFWMGYLSGVFARSALFKTLQAKAYSKARPYIDQMHQTSHRWRKSVDYRINLPE